MTPAVTIIFPNQLFEQHPALDKHRRVFLLEDDLFFEYQPFHKMKLVLHRASMKFYHDYLVNQGYRVTYVDAADYRHFEDFARRNLSDEGVVEAHYCEPVDFLLEKRMEKGCAENKLKQVVYRTPAFLNTKSLNEEFLGKTSKHYRLGDFYKKQRLHHNVLLENGKPMGGSWSTDAENRKALPKNYLAPNPYFPTENQYVQRAIDYVNQHFPNNPGHVRPFLYPVTFEEANQALHNFLQFRFNDFGPYQDALSADQPFLNHSLLSSSINNGLLTPDKVVQSSIAFGLANNINYSSLEGFIRQIIGWREFIRGIYERHGVEQRNSNFLQANRNLNGKLLGELKPLKEVQRKVENCAYAHHIERLMVLANFFTLAEVHPDEVYNYFMTYYIDAYDWVMVPNVYGMGLFADGGLMSTKPYVSSSRYLVKMGAKNDSSWSLLWDALYWRFVFIHQDMLRANHRTRPMTYHINRMSKEKLEEHILRANNFLDRF